MTKIIAEIGWNHMGNINLAKKMILAAKKSGADFVKTQIFSVDRLSPGPWDTDGRRQIYLKAQMSEDKLRKLKAYSKKIKIKFFSSVMSIPDAKMLLKISNDLVKIPSMECNNYELIKFCLKKFKHLIISTGASNFKEIRLLTQKIPSKKLTLLHCVSSYPCEKKNANLKKIDYLKKICKSVGFSDHCIGVDVSILSLSFNPKYIEKHFTINKNLPGRDNKFAILPHEMKNLKNFIETKKNAEVFKGINFLKQERDVRKYYRGRFNFKINE